MSAARRTAAVHQHLIYTPAVSSDTLTVSGQSHLPCSRHLQDSVILYTSVIARPLSYRSYVNITVSVLQYMNYNAVTATCQA